MSKDWFDDHYIAIGSGTHCDTGTLRGHILYTSC